MARLTDEQIAYIKACIEPEATLSIADAAMVESINVALGDKLRALEPAAGERGWREFYDEVMRRAEQEDDATVYADRIAYHLDIVAEEWGKEGESNG